MVRTAYAPSGNRLQLLNETRSAISHLNPSKLKPVPERGLERQLVEGGSRAAAMILNRKLGPVTGAYTLVTSSGDLLVARWEASEDTWLWDSPWQTVFVLRVPREVIRNADSLAQYCEALLAWSKPPLQLTAATILRFDAGDDNPTWVQGEGKHRQQERGLFQWQLAGLEANGAAFIAISVSKPFLRNFYPDESLVHERFPPLADRITQLSREALIDELGKGFRLEQGSTAYPKARDKVIVTELLSRGAVSAEEVRQIIVGAYDIDGQRAAHVVNSRLSLFLDALKERGELEVYAPALERLCLTAKSNGALADFSVGSIFGAMVSSGVPFSRVALAFVERGMFLNVSLFYLENYASDEETLQRVSVLTLNPDLEGQRKQAIDKIKARIASGH